MKRLPLTYKGEPAGCALVDDEDYERLSRFRWRWDGGYVVRTVPGASRSRQMHREVLGLRPGGPEVDHRDGDARNNQRSNLRLATRAQNGQNLAVRCDSKTGVRGVSWIAERRKYQAAVRINYRSINLGRFTTIEEAAAVVAAYRREHMPFSNEDRHAA